MAGRSALALACMVMVCCDPASALDEGGRCLRDKMKASRVAASGWLRCASSRWSDDVAGQRCRSRIEGRARRLLDAADARAAAAGFACPASGEALGIVGPSTWPQQFVGEMTGGDATCRARLGRTARGFASAYGRCVESNAEQPGDEALVEECARRSRADFLESWDTAGCASSNAEEAALRIEAEIRESAARLLVRCGDGYVGGFEICDDGNTADGDGCSADCRRETCGRVGEEVRCAACPSDSVPTAQFDGCRCPDGFEGEPGSCSDIDECASAEDPCKDGRPCVNLGGTWACATPCTAEAFHQALASCGAPSGAIAFDCTDTVIALAGDTGKLRDTGCSNLVIDGAGRGITFELDPVCWKTPLDALQCPAGLEEDGTCQCPDVDSGEQFLRLRGDRNVVRDLTVRGFFDGIPVRGRGNLVENVRFERMCDDAFGSVTTGVGNVFRDLVVRDGCDKCSENGGSLAATDPDPRVPEHFHAIVSDTRFEGCRTPLRVASSGRFLLERVTMVADQTQFSCDGPRFSASGGEAVVVELRQSTIEGCRHGVRFGRGSEGVVRDTRISGCRLRGLRVGATASVSIGGTTIQANGGGGSTESGFGGVAVGAGGRLDLGGGELEIDGAVAVSPGENTLCDNRGADGAAREIDNAGEESVAAQGNWWCSPEPPYDRIAGPAVVEPALRRAPLRVRPAP